MMKLNRVLVIVILISILFVITVVLSILGTGNLKEEANRYTECDILASIANQDGISILHSENADLILPYNTEIHVTGVHLDGYLEVDHVDVEISDEVLAYYQNHPAYSTIDPNIEERADLWVFYKRIKVSDVDSEELSKVYEQLCKKHDNFNLYLAVSAVLSSVLYFCPVVIVTARAIKKSQYGAVTEIVTLLSLVISLLLFRYVFFAFIGL